jgi:aspartyl-tRNA(Asn)/glutamyl-tRNA(Gln) amidotransferase subunit C
MTESKPGDAGTIDVAYVAHLARLELSAEETARLQSQMEGIVDYVRQLGELDVEGVEPMAHAVPVHNVFREDEPRTSLDRDAALANAPSERRHLFMVPRIIEE